MVVGPAAAGKTCLINRIVNKKFTHNYKQTLGVDFSILWKVNPETQ